MSSLPSRRALLAGLALPLLPLSVPSFALAAVPDPTALPVSAGTVRRYDLFPSALTQPRRVDVWLPPGYEAGRDRYSVLYMHDGQNLFDPASTAFGEWGVDEALGRLMAAGTVRSTIVVGIWNTPNRARDYMPNAPFQAMAETTQQAYAARIGGEPLSDFYGDFLVKELKPFIDKQYRTKPDRAQTFIMGSSMGGLISLYTMMRYPDVFGGAGCISTHWPISVVPEWIKAQDLRVEEIAGGFIRHVRANLPRAGRHKIYFDLGTAELDSLYPPYQARVDAFMPDLGYVQGKDWLTRIFEGEPHNEVAWRKRIDIPLTFLLG